MNSEKTPVKQKRKKISRACNHCHKAHMTCDTARPCQRCVQRGLQETCEDAPRKRKKYLADVPSSLIQANRQSPGPDSSGAMPTPVSDSTQMPINQSQVYQATMFQHSASLPNYSVHKPSFLARTPTVGVKLETNGEHFPDQPYQVDQAFYRNTNGSYGHNNDNNNGHNNDNNNGHNNVQSAQSNDMHGDSRNYPIELDVPKARKRTNFLSSAADLEYSTLSNILQDNFMIQNPNHSATSTECTPTSVNLSPALSPHGAQVPHKASPSSLSNSFSAGQQVPQEFGGSYIQDHDGTSGLLRYDGRINQFTLGGPSEAGPSTTFPNVIQAIENMKDSDPAAYYVRNSESALSFTIGISSEEQAGKVNDENLQFKEPEDIYANVTRPFSYTPGFHKLIAYLRNRFPKDMLVKMAESMAVYRPSFIACTNALREADLIFMEQCFQRTLLTYDKLLKVSGTPTIVWRRTGEIAYVGSEFTTLTGWTQEQLLGKKPMFIVEVLDDKSVVEYFELFSKIAFGDFLGATMTECTLLTPKKDVKIRAGCIWTLKRDVFGIPMMIIGNFLPIL